MSNEIKQYYTYHICHGSRPVSHQFNFNRLEVVIMAANTSSKVIQRYKHKVYKRVVADLPKELVAKWEERLKVDNIGKSEFIRNAIKAYLGEE